jgi:outer membrane protein TolC
LEKNLEATTLQRRMEVSKNLPSVAVGAGYNYHNLLDNDRHFGMLFATISVPISDWWGGSHAIRRRRIAEQQAREQLEDNAELLSIRIQKAWNDIEEARSQLQLAALSILQSAENLRIQRDTYQAGTSTMSDLLQAQLLYQQTLDQRTEAYIALQTAFLDYRHATGQ